MKKDFVTVVYDRKKEVTKTGRGKVEIRIYLGNGVRKYVTLISCDPFEWKEYEQKSKGRTKEQTAAISEGMMDIFRSFGAIREGDPASAEAQALVNKLQGYITENFYTCSDKILLSLSKMYGGGGSMTESIDKVGGPGTGEFAERAIAAHCQA